MTERDLLYAAMYRRQVKRRSCLRAAQHVCNMCATAEEAEEEAPHCA